MLCILLARVDKWSDSVSKSRNDQYDSVNITVCPRPFEFTVSTVLVGGQTERVDCRLNKL